MNPEQMNQFKASLEGERALLEKELARIGRRNPDNPADWEATPSDLDTGASDENDMADNVEEFESNAAILKQLEIRYNQVMKALERIEGGTYGICEIANEPIELDRLEANPAARTCKEHLNEEGTLS